MGSTPPSIVSDKTERGSGAARTLAFPTKECRYAYKIVQSRRKRISMSTTSCGVVQQKSSYKLQAATNKERSGRKPYNFQSAASIKLAAMPRALLAFDTGTGKSKIALDALRIARTSKAVIVCKVALITHWVRECKAENFTPFSYHGPARSISEFIAADTGVLIVSFNTLAEDINKIRDRLPYLPIIIDEAHLLVSAQAKRTWSVWKLRKSKAWLLTATPIMNGAEE
jgi:superfamily II DNA or RNA helicase